MTEWLLEPIYWNWFLLGVVLIIVEALAPGTFMVWMGIAALGVGLLLVLFPGLDWTVQWLFFALLSVGSVGGWWFYGKRHPDLSEPSLLNRRGHQYMGRTFRLDSPIVNGQGRMRVDDSTWKIVGEDCPAGTRVQVVGVEGIALKVEVIQEH